MADNLDVAMRSMNINSKLGPRLIEAAELNAVLKIGWTNAGEKVPKNGELGLCPALPEGARIRALGVFGSWIAPFGLGGKFTIQGDVGSFLAAGNNGNTVTCERLAGNHAGYAMNEGRINILEGVGSDCGAFMAGGLITVRGSCGPRVGAGMTDGLIVIHGDVANEPGIGMRGGRIVINGRCPTPPTGVSLRPLSEDEVKEINELLDDEELSIPNDAVCLTPTAILEVEGRGGEVSISDLSSIALVPSDKHQAPDYASCDTVSLIGERDGQNTPIALPLPLLPMIESGESLAIDRSDDPLAAQLLSKQAFMVRENPRPIDILIIDRDNLCDVGVMSKNCGGFAIDMDSLPAINSEEIDGLLVAMRALVGTEAPVMMIQGLGRIQSLHVRAAHHGIDLAITRVEDSSGLPEASALPLMGRSAKTHLDSKHTQTGMMLGFTADGQDLAVLKASGISVVCCEAPMLDAVDLASWLASIESDLCEILRRLGLASIDELSRSNLRALDHETAAISGLRLAGYERPLPHWFAR